MESGDLTRITFIGNTWSDPTNRESVIYDKLDNPVLGRVITQPLVLRNLDGPVSGAMALAWNERGAGETYTVQCTVDPGSGIWTNAPGSWPVSNPTLSDMTWTNAVQSPGGAFYRIRSHVP